MFLSGSLARRSFGAFLACLAIVSLGMGAVVRDMSGADRWLSAGSAVTRAQADGGHPFIRAAAIKLAAWHRNADDDRPVGGGDPALVPAIFVPALAGIIVFLFGPALASRPVSAAAIPYSARAPPIASI